MKTLLRISVCAALVASMTAHARVTAITVTSVEPFAPGSTFGEAGGYERVKGTFRGELDPADARNKVIVDLDKAPRNSAGKVEYEADFFMLRPTEPARGNGKVIYDVTNRGRLNFHWRFTESKKRSNDPRTLDDAGDGLFFRQGYTFVWSGWDPEAPTRGNGLAMKPVIATDGGKPIVRAIREEFISGTRSRDEGDGGSKTEGAVFRLTYEAASLDQSQASFTVRRTNDAPRREIPANGWRFVNDRTIQLLPEGTAAEPGSIYEVRYPAKNPRVLGVGLAATRDLVSFLRYDKGAQNPARSIKRALAFGSSQSGRFLRDFVRDGFNQDEGARKVFDGVMAHTAGIGGVFLNEPFAQPNRTSTQHEDHTFPEARTGTIFRNDGFDPLWMETNTATEYWQKGASLLTTDASATRDVDPPANARSYLIAGTQHNATAWMTSTRGSCVNPRNPHSPTLFQRALFVALDEWVDGKAPPASRVPKVADGTLTTVEQLRFPAIPGIVLTKRMHDAVLIRDWVKPDLEPARHRALVPQVDADGNDLAGVRMPDIAVPLATHTGWNLYRAPFPDTELCDRDGTYAPFARTRAEREARNDPRRSIEERYGSHAGYVKAYESAIAQLVRERLLLPEDAKRYVARARSAEVAALFTAPVVGQAAPR